MPRSVLNALPLCLMFGGCAQTSTTAVDWTAGPTVAEVEYLQQSLWDDGQAEIAIYRATRGKGEDAQSFNVGSFVIKHSFDPNTGSKAESGGVPSFKWAAMFEYELGSEQFKTSYVINQVKSSLRPLKVSMNRFDWCSNTYRELSFLPNGQVRHLMRSDDYGNLQTDRAAKADVYVFPQIWWLVRALDLSKSPVQFEVETFDGKRTTATATLMGNDTKQFNGKSVPVELIEITYPEAIPTLLGPTRSRSERFVRSTEGARWLLEAHGEGYDMELVEVIRSPYWRENIWARLTQTKDRP
jgi:hypothetical protein